MKYFIKKIYLILIFTIILILGAPTSAKDSGFKYSKEDTSNYFSGIISLNQNNATSGFKYLNKVQSLKNTHSNFKIQFIRTLVLLDKFDQAFTFSKSVWLEDEYFFEADLLLGMQSFINKDYLNAEKYFKRLNRISQTNLLFEDFIGNVLITWVKASENNKKDSFKFFDKIPDHYGNLKQIQNSFLQCFFDTSKTEIAYEQLINSKDSGFSRYNFFLINYFLTKNENKAVEMLISKNKSVYNSNLLIRQAEDFIINGKNKKITNFFNCKNPRDAIAEMFYVIANLYSTQEDYQLSSFYLKISTYFNDKFTPNKALLAENFYNQKKYELAKKTYNEIKLIGPIYSWYASKSIAAILSNTLGTKKSTSSLEKAFNLLLNPNFVHYFQLANFYKDNEYFEKSIKYYSLALKNIKQDHDLVPKILDRRGTSYERIGDWKKAEKDLAESLRILPDQPHVLNYLAYSWVDKKINIEKALEMLKKATKLKENDGYIIDSLGWAYYANKNYVDAEKFLQKAVELMPQDPIINDHYADTLWMLNKDIQARYFWKHVLSLDNVEQELKENISKKLIFGITKKL